MLFVQEVISAVRTIRAELNINPSFKLTVQLRPADDQQARLLSQGSAWLSNLARVENLILDSTQVPPKASASDVVRGCVVIVHLAGAVDPEAELVRLDKEIGKTEKDLEALGSKLRNENFITRAPAQVVDEERRREQEARDKLEKMRSLQGRFRDVLE